jgi:hypothetical protein
VQLQLKLSSTIFIIAASLVPASAAVVTFSGEDIMATTTSAHPNSTLAAANFDAAVAGLGTAALVTFEGATLGSFSNLTIAPGASMNGTDYNGVNQTIRNTSNSPAIPTLDGYNTTAGGSYFVEMQAGKLTFAFANPVEAFGAYFSGVQFFFAGESIQFSDGTSELISIPEAQTNGSTGALDFVGFTDVGKSITSITIDAGTSSDPGADYIGVDDVRFLATPVAVSGVPEPSSIGLALSGSIALALVLRRRRTTQA